MRKVYYLSTCSTCKRIMSDLDLSSFELIDIKESGVHAEDLALAAKTYGSYEALFSKRAMKYRSLGLHEQNLTEKDFKNLILEEYTFLKRPMFIIDNQIFVGNSKKTINAIHEALS